MGHLLWAEIGRIDWGAIRQVARQDLEGLLSRYSEIFKDELGTLKDHRANLDIKDGANPRFLRARPVPFALKKAIEQS